MDDKKSYIEQEILKLLQYWGSIAVGVGALVIVALCVLDYFVTPENFIKFLIYRLVTASLFIIIFLLNRKIANKHFQIGICILAGLIVSIMVELMVLSFGGHESSYYVGFIIVFMFCLGFLPLLSIRTSIFLAAMLYCVYLLPILIFDTITNIRTFINNNIFLLATATIAVAWRYYNDKIFVKELSLEYDLSQDKEKLEKYSTRLEELVAERTRELNKSELMLRSLFENANDGIVIMDKDGKILNANQKACEMHGFDKDALIGTNIELLELQENKQSFNERKKRILNGESMLFETQHYRRDGSRVSLEISAKAIEVEGNLLIQSFQRDIADRKRLQEQLFQSQKMESIGVLAGGIAHDFNNILSAILGHAELLHEFGNLDAAAKQRVKIIENSSRKAGQMVSKLLSFARQGSFESVPLNLNDVIKDSVELIERMMNKKKVDMKIELDDAIPSINGDSNQMEQVIMNLAVNAGDAMPNGGLITISTATANLEKDASLVHPLLEPGRYVTLRISDTGTGIPDAIRDRIFDPFFTTKETGKGTGLGLAMVYGIVKEHRGVINVKSHVGKGTTFEIYLPASDKAVQRAGKSPVYSMTGREKILVVDDEKDVLSFMKDVLEAQGYRVLVSDNPIYALDIFKQISDDIDLVVTDIVMPLVNGKDLIRSFKTIKPSVKMIAISGYDIWNIGKKDKDIDAYIRKPFEGIYLLSIVRRVLDSEGSSTYSRQLPL